ncbi:AraC family transcriptional regulator, partial [Candidatus Aminicenantes bacterium AC-335-A11]|nr:AraC family transcriptional regulator [Candidatus Aminicenantes bacterium AC-335-A11]
MDLRVKKALKFIEENLDKNLTLNKVARYCNLNYSRFRELFRKEVKMSFSKYLIHLRIKTAMELLKETELEIKQISSQVGYKDVSNFCHHFKEVTGISPSLYRKISKIFIFRYFRHLDIKIVRFTNSVIK